MKKMVTLVMSVLMIFSILSFSDINVGNASTNNDLAELFFQHE